MAGTNTIAVEVHQNSRDELRPQLRSRARRRGQHRRRRHRPSRRRPRALTLGTVTPNSVALSWSASTDDFGVDHYTVLRNGTPVGTTTATELHRQHRHRRPRVHVHRGRGGRGEQHVGSRRTRSRPTHRTSRAPSHAGSVGRADADRHDRGASRGSRRRTTSASTTTTCTGTACWSAARRRRRSTTPGSRSRRATPTRSWRSTPRTCRRRPSAPLTITTPAPSSTATLVAAGSIWRYLDNGSNQGTAWRAPGFNDSTWASGPALLGYGHGDEATDGRRSGRNATQKYLTTYFRTHVQRSPNAGSRAVAADAPGAGRRCRRLHQRHRSRSLEHAGRHDHVGDRSPRRTSTRRRTGSSSTSRFRRTSS